MPILSSTPTQAHWHCQEKKWNVTILCRFFHYLNLLVRTHISLFHQRWLLMAWLKSTHAGHQRIWYSYLQKNTVSEGLHLEVFNFQCRLYIRLTCRDDFFSNQSRSGVPVLWCNVNCDRLWGSYDDHYSKDSQCLKPRGNVGISVSSYRFPKDAWEIFFVSITATLSQEHLLVGRKWMQLAAYRWHFIC